MKVTTGTLPASALPEQRMLAPTAEGAPVSWRYTLEKPADDWLKPAFDDRNWREGAAPFGKEEPAVARRPNTIWTNADIWLRREFEMPPGQCTEFTIQRHHDEDTGVYCDGVAAVKVAGHNSSDDAFEVAPETAAALKPGRITLAVHCRQTTGGQYTDVGLQGVPVSAGEDSPENSACGAWRSFALRNGLVELQVVPDIGGRCIQYKLGNKESLRVNPALHRKSPPRTRPVTGIGEPPCSAGKPLRRCCDPERRRSHGCRGKAWSSPEVRGPRRLQTALARLCKQDDSWMANVANVAALAWLADWDVDFKLHAPGPTIVEGVLRRGRLASLKVTPPSRANDIVHWLGKRR